MKFRSRILAFFLLLGLLISCAALFPPRDFKVALWQPDITEGVFKHLDENTGQVLEIPFDEVDPQIYVLISIEDYIKERKYQELLIKSCREWR